MGIFGGFRIWGRLSVRMGVFTCEVRSGMGVYFELVLTGQPPINTVIPSKYSLTISSRNSFLFYSASGGLRRSCSNDRGTGMRAWVQSTPV